MKRTFRLFVGFIFFTVYCFGQEPIEVTQQTLKVGGFKEEELLFGFAEGDRIVFSFQEANNKELKEVEIVEYPNNSKFSDYKTNKIEKIITVNKQGVYMFRFKNSAMGGRVCRIKIERIPASETTKNFNSTVTWVNKQDTTWNNFTREIIVGHDTTYVQKQKKELIKIDTLITSLFDKTLRVHSETAIGKGKSQFTYATVELPKNSYTPSVFAPYQTTEVVAWSYWLGVGQKAKDDYEAANKNLASGVKVIGSLTGYGALASLAATGISLFGAANIGDNVKYRFFGIQNGHEIPIDFGNVISASGRNEKIRQGSFTVELYNDNFKDGINVDLKMVVMQVSKTWKDLPYTERRITPRVEKKLFREPVINTNRVATCGL